MIKIKDIERGLETMFANLADGVGNTDYEYLLGVAEQTGFIGRDDQPDPFVTEKGMEHIRAGV